MLTQFTETQFRYLIAWNRSVDSNQRCRVVCTGNPPTEAEGQWVIDYWGPWLDEHHPNPAEELVPIITEAKALAAQAGRYLAVVCSLTGTEQDPQGKQAVKRALQDAGAIVMESNAAACELAGYMC